ncbi:MAG: UDP-N-acetylmuramoyl-tripeptide--D-alanyl-D-alanine ligase [Patescibacteria group bacterium]|nr:UDP-N-acetylmuramoyl-tripeptide--D-alanyl-D-alanine ligase [Patescibacteria group bacterium]
MKSRKILLLEKILKYLATRTLRRFKPRVVGVTGSVGKTSTKEAIYTVLASKFRVRKNEKNYNNEIGLPLTILGLESGGGSFAKWALVLLRALGVAYLESKNNYPEILVLEMGADCPGDIKYLVDFIQPEVGVVTAIGVSHLEFFKDKKQIAKEKSTLVKYLNKEGIAVLNFDDEDVRTMAEEIKVKKVFYGFSEKASVRASDIFFGYEKSKDVHGGDVSKIKGISFKLSFEGATVPVRLMRSVGRPQIYSVLAATVVGIHFEMNLMEVATALKNFQAPAGRLNIIDGIKNTIIIEDSYNAAPQSTLAALEVLEKIQARRKLAALGNMLELGEETESGHREVGRKVAEVADVLFAVGDKAKFIADEAEKTGLAQAPAERAGLDKNNIFCYDTSSEAKIPIQKELQEGDVILVKGSQGARMEKISEEIMRYPEQAEKLLPRQTAEWRV